MTSKPPKFEVRAVLAALRFCEKRRVETQNLASNMPLGILRLRMSIFAKLLRLVGTSLRDFILILLKHAFGHVSTGNDKIRGFRDHLCRY